MLAAFRGEVYPAAATVTRTTRYGAARAAAWSRPHQQLARRAGWENHDGELPVVEGTLIRLQAGHLPGDRSPEQLWLWSSRAGTSEEEVNRTWQAFLRRFDIEHTFRFLKQRLGWTRPKLRDPAAADRRTWLILTCYAQLYLARPLAAGGPADSRPGPARVPEQSKNRRPATRHDVGKTTKRDQQKKETCRQAG